MELMAQNGNEWVEFLVFQLNIMIRLRKDLNELSLQWTLYAAYICIRRNTRLLRSILTCLNICAKQHSWKIIEVFCSQHVQINKIYGLVSLSIFQKFPVNGKYVSIIIFVNDSAQILRIALKHKLSSKFEIIFHLVWWLICWLPDAQTAVANNIFAVHIWQIYLM